MSYSNKLEWVNWIENAISEKHIKNYEYKKFSNREVIGSGGFGRVYRANWKTKTFALKSLNNATAEKIVYELKIQREVDFHENIIRFFGITIDNQNYSSEKYMLVMEYADSGTLRDYLGNNFEKLTLNNKYKMAQQLSDAVSCLHNENIIHRDLHSNNVLIHKKNIKLADFGLSKMVDSTTSQKGGIYPYIDPKSFVENTYSLNKKSDVYSIGVLLWEITSGQPPFKDENYYSLVTRIPNGLRETPIPNTPDDYVKMYTDCWKYEPDDRPTIDDVVVRLKAITSNKTTRNRTPSINNSSHPSHDNLSRSFKRKGSKSKKDIVDGIATLNITTRNRTPSINNSSHSSHDNLSQSLGSKSKKDIVDGIATLPYKIYDKNKKQKILDYLKDHHVTPKEIFDWLSNNQSYPNSLLVLGDFNYLGIATKVDKKKAYDFYFGAGDGDDGLSVAQYNLGFICENDKLGDALQAMYWYKKSYKQGNHEAEESYHRLQSAPVKFISPDYIDKLDVSELFPL